MFLHMQIFNYFQKEYNRYSYNILFKVYYHEEYVCLHYEAYS